MHWNKLRIIYFTVLFVFSSLNFILLSSSKTRDYSRGTINLINSVFEQKEHRNSRANNTSPVHWMAEQILYCAPVSSNERAWTNTMIGLTLWNGPALVPESNEMWWSIIWTNCFIITETGQQSTSAPLTFIGRRGDLHRHEIVFFIPNIICA